MEDFNYGHETYRSVRNVSPGLVHSFAVAPQLLTKHLWQATEEGADTFPQPALSQSYPQGG